jgi:hypothetical protein
MRYLAGLAVLLTMSVRADTGSKPSSSGSFPSPALLTGFSAWKPLPMLRNGVVNPMGRRDFNDLRFEYRWKSSLTAASSVCTVEFRAAGDVDYGDTIPEITFNYTPPRTSRRHPHGFTEHDIAIGGPQGHASFTATDCERVDLVYWRK